MRKFKGEQLVVDEVYATPHNIDFVEVSSAPSVKHKNLGQMISTYNQRQSMILSAPNARQPRVYSCYADFQLPKFPETSEMTNEKQVRRFSSSGDISAKGYSSNAVEKETSTVESEDQKKAGLFHKFEIPKLRRLSIARSISDSFNTPVETPSFVRKLQNRISSLKVEVSKDELSQEEETPKIDSSEDSSSKKSSSLNDQVFSAASSVTVGDNYQIESEKYTHSEDFSDEISLLSVGTLESLLNGYLGDLGDFLLHRRQATGTSSVYDDTDLHTIEDEYFTPPSNFSSRFSDQSPHSIEEGSFSLFSSLDDSTESNYTDALSYTSSTHFKSLDTTYSQKPLPAPPIFSFNQGDVRNYHSNQNVIMDTGVPPQVPKHHFLQGEKMDLKPKDNLEWGADADAAVPNQKVVIPKDTSIYTRRPTYSKIKKQYGEIPILSNRVDKKEESERSASLQYLENVGIEPFMLSGYQECTKLKIVN